MISNSAVYTYYCGFVAIVGRPNVGKSTLLNSLIGKKVSITSSKPQTTYHRIMGIQTEGQYQSIYIDTPGLYLNKDKKLINRLLNKITITSIYNVDIVIFVVESIKWTRDDEMVLEKLLKIKVPVFLLINKLDILSDKKQLLPYIDFLQKKFNFSDVLQVSAAHGIYIDTLSRMIRKFLPEGNHLFPKTCITNLSKKFIASEIIREKLIRLLRDELPYSVKVKIERFYIQKNNCYNIYGLILVQHNGQKKIVIGNGGNNIKNIGIQARKDMEKIFNTYVHLTLWVTVN